MENFDKQEFLKEFLQGDIYGLENAEEQIRIELNEVHKEMKFNNKRLDIEYEEVEKNADILCNREEKLNKVLTLIKYTKQVNYILVETETESYASEYNVLSRDLYDKVLNDLMDLLGVTNQDIENYQNGVDNTEWSKNNRPINRTATFREMQMYLGLETGIDNSEILKEFNKMQEKYKNQNVDFCLKNDFETGFFKNIHIIETGKYLLVYDN